MNSLQSTLAFGGHHHHPSGHTVVSVDSVGSGGECTVPRYGPLPCLARAAVAGGAVVRMGSAPLHRRLRHPPPPPAYSDLDELDSDRGEAEPEPRYQPMPLHSLRHSRRPLPSHPPSNHNTDANHQGFVPLQQSTNSPSTHRPHRTSARRHHSDSSESAEGDYEDISQL